jgi:hypothetical protein
LLDTREYITALRVAPQLLLREPCCMITILVGMKRTYRKSGRIATVNGSGTLLLPVPQQTDKLHQPCPHPRPFLVGVWCTTAFFQSPTRQHLGIGCIGL